MTRQQSRQKAKNSKNVAARATPYIPTHVDVLQRYSIEQAAALLKQSRAQTFIDIRNGTLRTITAGTRRFVPGSEIARLSTLPAEAQAMA